MPTFLPMIPWTDIRSSLADLREAVSCVLEAATSFRCGSIPLSCLFEVAQIPGCNSRHASFLIDAAHSARYDALRASLTEAAHSSLGDSLRESLGVLLAEGLDLDVDARGKIELHQRVDGLGRRLEDVQQPFVGPDLELLAALLVHVGRPED